MSSIIGVTPLPSPHLIMPQGRLAATQAVMNQGLAASGAGGAQPWSDAANAILAWPFTIETSTPIYKAVATKGTPDTSKHWEVGVWDADYTKLMTTGSVTVTSGSNEPQAAAFTSSFTLDAGLYYCGMVYDATASTPWYAWSAGTAGAAVWQSVGCWRQSGVTIGSLAASATPGDITNAVFPAFGLITRSAFDA